MNVIKRIANRTTLVALICTATGLAVGVLGGQGLAQVEPPTEHKGLEVETLGLVPAESMAAQSTPGLVYMESGTWTEGRDTGETEHSAGDTFIEDKDTVHWFYNRGAEPAAALVCDIKPAS